MSHIGCSFFLAFHANDDQDRVVSKAMEALLSLLGFKYRGETARLIPDQEAARKLIVIPSTCEQAQREYLEEILRLGYGPFEEDTGLGTQRYLFLDTGFRPIYFDVLSRTLCGFRVARTASFERVFPAIAELIESFQESFQKDVGPISSKRLQYHIEHSCLPSGAEELQELLFRNTACAHPLFGSILDRFKEKDDRQKEKPDRKDYAIRLLLGAFASGDIDLASLKKAIVKVVADDDFEFSEEIETWLEKIVRDRHDLHMEGTNLSSLSDYLANRRILFVEDQLQDHYWDVVLPVLFGCSLANEKIQQGKAGQAIGNVVLSHANNAQEALTKYGPKLHEFDIILLDLLSSAKKSEDSTGHDGQTLSTIGQSVLDLAEKLRSLYYDQTSGETGKHSVPTALPQIVVFSVDSAGVTARTLLKELGASDYFFKSTQGEPHKGGYYASFRNALIKSLKETVSHVLGVQYSNKHNKLDNWLSQFRPADRPLILRIMKHFRYYSAMSIVNILDEYVDSLSPSVNDRKISLFGSRYRKPTQYWFSYLGRPNKSGPATLVLMAKTKWIRNLNNKRTLQPLDRKERQPQFKEYDDLQRELVKNVPMPESDRENGLCLIFVDDMIGSGGQLNSYIWKFINDHLVKTARDINDDRDHEAAWRKIRSAFRTRAIELHALFAVGIRNKILEGMLDNIRVNTQIVGERNQSLENALKNTKQGGRSLSGLMQIALCSNPNHTGAEGPRRCTCMKEVPVHLHIADYADSIFDICADEEIEDSALEEVLGRYVFIVNPRDKEYPCDFEPLGWKKCGGLVATYANTPGNTLPIIWGDRDEWGDGNKGPWIPIFPRFFNPWDDGSTEKSDLHCKRTGRCKVRPDAWKGIVLCGDREPPCKPSA